MNTENTKNTDAEAQAGRRRSIQRPRVHTEVLSCLLDDIQSGVYQVGQKLPSERELMDEFGVGRPAVREALSGLARMGLIEVSPGMRARVCRLTLKPLLREMRDAAGDAGEFYTPRPVVRLMVEMIDPQLGEIVLDPACGTGGFLTAVIEHLKASANTVAEREAIAHNVRGWEYKPLPYMLANTNLILHDIITPSIQFGDSLQRPLSEYTRKERVDVIIANPPFGGVVSNNNENNFPQTYRTKESADLFLILMIHLLKEGGRAAIVLPDGSLTGDGVKQRIRQKLLEDCNLHTIVRLPNSVFQPYASVATNLLFFTKGEPTQSIWYYEHKLPEGYKAYSKTKPIQLAEFETLKSWWTNREANEQAWQVDIDTIKANGYNLDIKNPHRAEEEKQYSSTELLDLLHQSFAKSDQLLEQLRKELV